MDVGIRNLRQFRRGDVETKRNTHTHTHEKKKKAEIGRKCLKIESRSFEADDLHRFLKSIKIEWNRIFLK